MTVVVDFVCVYQQAAFFERQVAGQEAIRTQNDQTGAFLVMLPTWWDYAS